MGSCAQGAISIQAGRITLAGPVSGKHADPEPVIQKRRKLGRIAWGVAIAVLLFALAWFNWIEPAQEAAKTPKPDQTAAAHSQTETQSSEKADAKPAAAAHPETEAQSSEKADVKPAAAATGTIGSEVGDLLPDFRTELLGGGQFQLSDYRGQVVILNLWATTCAPCIEELPYYEKLKVAHPDVEILAIHHRAGAKKAENFLADKGWDHLDIALDSKEKGLFSLLGASDAMPQTIVLNKEGKITYNVQAPLTYEQLEELVSQAS